MLHPIRDYLAFVDLVCRRLRPGGTIVTFHDPLWYARVGRATRAVDRLGYYLSRVQHGNLAAGLATLSRPVRGVLDESNPADTVEYHVVRDGVDEEAIARLLRPSFEVVEIARYWSNQSAVGLRVGRRLGLANNFGVVARGFGFGAGR
ncbi:MAG: hypothetical protein ACRD2W_23360 [Acidimicrobiales bacterium]